MKNTLLSITAIVALSGAAFAQTYTAASFGGWTQSGNTFTGTVFQGGGAVGTATATYSLLEGFNTPAGGGAGSFLATAAETVTPNPTTARIRWNFSIAAGPSYAVQGISFFTSGTELANPTLTSINNAGGVVSADAGNTGDITLLESSEFWADGADGDLNPSTLSAVAGPIANGYASGTHEVWSLNSSSSALNVTYTADSSVNNIAAEGLRFDATLIQVPEPSSTALLGLGALGLISRRKRA